MKSADGHGDVRFVSRAGQLRFSAPLEILEARSISEVPSLLRHAAGKVAQGNCAAGFLTYEAAPAFDSALRTHPPGDLPLAWFGIYDAPEVLPQLHPMVDGAGPVDWRPLIDEAEYRRGIARIRELIAAGDTYQLNYTFPMQAPFDGGVWEWFTRLSAAQRGDHGAYIHAGRFQVLSASPELFFRLDGDRIVTRPMKGTHARGLWPDQDKRFAEALANSEKDRAENLMIVDLLRNDLGRIAHTGTVVTGPLFQVERYETLLQLTSTVSARTDADVPEIIAALFPSGSVTGAPKVRTMEIIRDLEPHPRGIYCGTIGWWGPDRRAEFNVAIRTVTVDTASRTATYNVGGGITWDSTPEGEFEECGLKAAVLTRRLPDFNLIESLRWDGDYFLLDAHLERLRGSADYFGFPYDEQAIRRALDATVAGTPPRPAKVRLRLARSGAIECTAAPLVSRGRLSVGIATRPIDPSAVLLYHKTTHRAVYDEALAQCPGCDDVVLWNVRGEVTESTIANVVVERTGRFITPPLECGLLPGVFRATLIASGQLEEDIITLDELRRAPRVHLINSVRGWIDVTIVD